MQKQANNKKNWDEMTIKERILELAPAILIPIILCALVRYFFCFSIIYGNSMEPTLHNGQAAILRCHSQIKYNDIVVFSDPSTEASWIDNTDNLIKRVIGLPGDEILLSEDGTTVYRNGVPLDEPYLATDTLTLPSYFKNRLFVVPENSLFVLGDNRENSTDSRFSRVGFVPLENVIGKVIYVFGSN